MKVCPSLLLCWWIFTALPICDDDDADSSSEESTSMQDLDPASKGRKGRTRTATWMLVAMVVGFTVLIGVFCRFLGAALCHHDHGAVHRNNDDKMHASRWSVGGWRR